ncbi:MAG: hypothetical protein JSS98_15500 [Bacteroidetes bacterium]|nr:hypothetical protein [Bacteroidota bacterium]
MNYIDVKITVWNRLAFSNDSDMTALVKEIEQYGLDEVIDDAKGFIESSTLYDTEEQLTPDDNGKASTIEVYQNKELIWENGENELQQY